MRDLARPNAKNPAYKQLQAMPEMKDCVFVPLKQHVFMEFGKRVVRFIPYMPDLVFVHKSREELDPIVRKMELLQYRYVRGGKQIRIIGGRLNGFEGRLMSKKGSKFKRLLIDLRECNLAAAIQVESEFIQLMK